MLKYEKEKEKAAFKKMTFREKLTHINNYYRLPIVIGTIAKLIGSVGVGSLCNPSAEKAFISNRYGVQRKCKSRDRGVPAEAE